MSGRALNTLVLPTQGSLQRNELLYRQEYGQGSSSVVGDVEISREIHEHRARSTSLVRSGSLFQLLGQSERDLQGATIR